MIVEQVLLISAIVSSGSVMMVGGINYIKNKVININNINTKFKWESFEHKNYNMNLDDLDARDIYNEPFMYKHDLSNICVDPLVPEKT